jgi:hypothetical protein
MSISLTFGICLAKHVKVEDAFNTCHNRISWAFSRRVLIMAESTPNSNIGPSTQPDSSPSSSQSPNPQPGSAFSSSSAPPQACAQCGKSPDSLKQCIKCHSVTYCNKDCQKAHYKAHKKACPMLAQEYVKLHEPKMASKSSASAPGGREKGLQKWQVCYSMSHADVELVLIPTV